MLKTLVWTDTQWQKARVIDSLILADPILWFRPIQYVKEKEETFPTATIIRDVLGYGDCDCGCILYGSWLLGSEKTKSFAIPCFLNGEMHVVLGVPSWGLVIDPSLVVFENLNKGKIRITPIIRRL